MTMLLAALYFLPPLAALPPPYAAEYLSARPDYHAGRSWPPRQPWDYLPQPVLGCQPPPLGRPAVPPTGLDRAESRPMHRAVDSLALSASAGAIGSAFGAITNDQIVTWVGVCIATGSALSSAAISIYQKFRAAVRQERAADEEAADARTAKQAERLAEFERRIEAMDVKLALREGRAGRPRRRKPGPNPGPNQ